MNSSKISSSSSDKGTLGACAGLEVGEVGGVEGGAEVMERGVGGRVGGRRADDPWGMARGTSPAFGWGFEEGDDCGLGEGDRISTSSPAETLDWFLSSSHSAAAADAAAAAAAAAAAGAAAGIVAGDAAPGSPPAANMHARQCNILAR